MGDLVDKFLEENKIDPTKMTAEEAQQCVDAVKRSKRPPIETFLKFLKGGGGVFRAPLLLCPACGVLRDTYTPSEDNGA